MSPVPEKKEFFESVPHFLIEKMPWMADDLKLRIIFKSSNLMQLI